MSLGADRYASRADAISANALLRWPLLAGQVAHPGRVPPEDLAAYIRAGALAPVVVPLLREIPLRQVQPLPADRDYPVRLVWADRDRVLPFAGFGAAMLERIPGAELIRLRDVGHVPMSDDPARVAELIAERLVLTIPLAVMAMLLTVVLALAAGQSREWLAGRFLTHAAIADARIGRLLQPFVAHRAALAAAG